MAAAGDPAGLASALAALGPRHVLVKLGARGAVELSAGEVRHGAPYRVTELDPVGAGDAFAAGWLAGWLTGADPERRLDTACAAGAFAVTAGGDWESLPCGRTWSPWPSAARATRCAASRTRRYPYPPPAVPHLPLAVPHPPLPVPASGRVASGARRPNHADIAARPPEHRCGSAPDTERTP
nr:hypothetical protein GCM10020093_029640 [Planobispora longispora]